MKNLILKFSLISAFIFIFSCSKKDENTTNILIDKLDCLGFDHNKVEMLDENTVLVEGDIIFEKDMILNPEKYAIHSHDHVEDRQYTSGAGLIAPDNVDIDYWIDPIVPATWVTAITTAAADWTSLTNCSITFTRLTAPPVAGTGLIFTTQNTTNAAALARAPTACFTIPIGIFATAKFPMGGFVGSLIIINLGMSPNASGQLTIMRHEIGHTLGFRHSDSVANGESNVISCDGTMLGAPAWIPCTPTNDGTSIMRSTTSGTVLTAINNNDAWSARLYYSEGAPTGGVAFKSYNYTTGRITIQANSNYCPRIKVVRNSSGITKYDGCPGGTFLEVDNLPSPYIYTVTLYDAAGTAVSTTTQSVHWF